MHIGYIDNISCHIGKSAPNHSIVITGKSGTGKSCCGNKIELSAALDGNTVIVIDTSQNHQEEYLLPQIKEVYSSYVNRIDAVEDGLGLQFLHPLNFGERAETQENVISSVVDIFGSSLGFGSRQRTALRKIIITALLFKERWGISDEAALFEAFDGYSHLANAQDVKDRFDPLFSSGLFRSGTKQIQPGKINIIDLKGIEPRTATDMASIILAYVWRVANLKFPKELKKVILSLDEFQNIPLGKRSVLRTILREGRRFDLSVLLTTQTLETFPKEVNALLMQSATRLIFKPSDTEMWETAKLIDPENSTSWHNYLKNLQIGECVALGAKNVGGVEITRPIILK